MRYVGFLEWAADGLDRWARALQERAWRARVKARRKDDPLGMVPTATVADLRRAAERDNLRKLAEIMTRPNPILDDLLTVASSGPLDVTPRTKLPPLSPNDEEMLRRKREEDDRG